MGALRIPQPNEKQRLFLSDRHRYIAYGGARGGGKSWAVRVKAALLCLKYGGIKVMIVRKTYPELQENHILPLCELLHVYDEDPERRLALYNDQKKHIVFPNGSRILFRYCDNDTDAQRFQGTEVDVLFVDEATQQSEERMDKLRACVRGVNPFPKRVYYTMNPGGEGHGWAKRLFLDRIYREGEDPEDYSFIPALVTDNTALMRADTDYVRKLRALPPKLRDAWLYGRWDIFEGQFFEDFRATPDLAMAQKYGFSDSSEELKRQRRFTHVIEAFDLAAGDKRGGPALDPGKAVFRDRADRTRAPLAPEPQDRRRRRSLHLGRQPGRIRRRDRRPARDLLRPRGKPAHPRLDAVPLPAAVRRAGLSAYVRLRQLRRLPAHRAAHAVFQKLPRGSGHRDGGPRLRRVALRVYVAARDAAPERGGRGRRDRPTEPEGIARSRRGERLPPSSKADPGGARKE